MRSKEELRTWLREQVHAHWCEHGYGMFALFEKHRGGRGAGEASVRKLVGWAGLLRSDAAVSEVELVVAVAPAYQGAGYGAEISRMLVGLAFGPLDLKSVVAFVLPDNAGAVGLLDKLGFDTDGEEDRGGLRHVRYRKRRETWAPQV